jgi:hypothetical protein
MPQESTSYLERRKTILRTRAKATAASAKHGQKSASCRSVHASSPSVYLPAHPLQAELLSGMVAESLRCSPIDRTGSGAGRFRFERGSGLVLEPRLAGTWATATGVDDQ